MKKKLAALLLAACMAMSLLPLSALADTPAGGLQAQIDGASGTVTLTLGGDTTESITVPSGKTVTLELNGHKLTNTAGCDTITVGLGGTLTVTGSGTVDNVSHGKAAVFNNGTVALSGGTYTRSKENGMSAESSGGNSYYNILNHGTMTINAGVSVTQTGHFSSLVANGYYDYKNNRDQRTGYVSGTNTECPEMTINGGTFSGGINTIKNDDNATLTINSGTFSNFTQHVVLNHNVAAIENGTFDASESATVVIYNCGCAADHDKGELTITGGNFKGNGSTEIIYNKVKSGVQSFVKVSGGYFTKEIDGAYIAENKAAVGSDKSGYTWMIGTAPTNNVKPAVGAAQVPENTSVAEEAKTAAETVMSNDLAAYAATAAGTVGQAAIEAAKAELTNPGGTVHVYAQAYLAVKPTAYDAASHTLTMDIKPMYCLVASTADTAAGIVLKDDDDPSNVNAVAVTDSDKPLSVTGSVSISIDLPSGFNVTDNKVYVQHKGYEYVAAVTTSGSAKTATFTNPHGFSEFTISAASQTAATIGDVSYTSVQAAIKAAKSGDTIVLTKDCTETLTVPNMDLTISCGAHTLDAAKVTTSGSKAVTGAAGTSDLVIAITYIAPPYVPATPSTEPETPVFTDVPAGAEYYNAVLWAVEKGVTKGTGATTFSPNGSCTRAEAVTFLWRAMGEPEPTSTSCPFTDVKEGWYYKAVLWAVESGVTKGVSSTRFAPGKTCSRGEIVSFLARTAGVSGSGAETRFSDVSSSAYYANAVAWAVANGVTKGTGGGRFSPNAVCTRAQIVSFLYRYLAD